MGEGRGAWTCYVQQDGVHGDVPAAATCDLGTEMTRPYVLIDGAFATIIEDAPACYGIT